MVGMFGAVVFDAASYLVKEMKRGASSEWAEHKILGNIPTLERTGGECSTFSCTVTFNSRHTMTLETGLVLLESYAKTGQHFPLIVGLQLVGGFSAPEFVLTKVEAQYGVVDNRGRGLHSSVECEFKQYRVAASTASPTASGLGGLGSALGGIASAVSGVGAAVSSVTGAISGVTGAVSGITGAISGVTGAISGVTGAVSGVTGAVSSIQGVVSSLPGFSAISSAITNAGGVVGAINNIPNMIGSVGGKALAAIPAAIGGTGNLLPAGVRIS